MKHLKMLLTLGWLSLACNPALAAGDLKAGAASEPLIADDSMVIGGGIGPGKASGQEGELRASAWWSKTRTAQRSHSSPATS